MIPAKKLIAFEYLVSKLIDWFKELSNADYQDEFSKVKVLKLHFFVTAVSADQKNKGLLSVFDNFYAMPYGHVESDIYSNFDKLLKYDIRNSNIFLKSPTTPDLAELEEETKALIDDAIKELRKKNENLVLYDAFDLVELSHNWYSWQLTYSMARKEGKNSWQIPVSLIQNEKKIFKLSNALVEK